MPNYEKEYVDKPELKTYEAVIAHWKPCAQMYKESCYLWRVVAISAIFLQIPFWTCLLSKLLARKVTVINQRMDTILFQMSGNYSINKKSDGDLAVIGENDDGTYYKHFIYLSSEITYIVEDSGKTGVNKYKYEINSNPKMIIPAEAVTVD